MGRPVRSAVASLLACASAPAFAQQVAAPAAPAPPVLPDQPLDPGAPLAELPGIGVDWPDLAKEPGTTAGAANGAVAERRYTWRIDGLEAVETALIRQRFDAASALNEHDRQPANAAQLDRRARDDADLLAAVLRAAGYYDARVAARIEQGERPLVVLTATPGGLYRFSGVTLAGVLAAGGKAATLDKAFGVKPGDPVDADKVTAGEAALRQAAGREGFPFARIGEPDVVVDHATQTATLALDVQPGAALRWGRIVAAPGNRVFDPAHIQEIARWRPGQPYDAAGLDDLRRALVQTSLVSAAELTPVPGTAPGTVDVRAKLDPAPRHTIAGELGYGTGEGARAEVDWTDRNLFPPEGALTLRGVLGTEEQLGSVIFRRANFHGRDRILTAQVAAAHTVRDAYDARTFSLSGSLERQTNIFFQKAWTWSVGGEVEASDERDVIETTGAPRERTYFIGALPTSLAYDGSNDLLNPSTGFRLAGRFSPELSLEGAAFGYARYQIDASGYYPIGGVVLAARTRLGAITGASRDTIAPTRRFYAGGGASVRGYGYQAIGPKDPNNAPVGGTSLNEFSIEARVHAFGSFGVVPFLDAGNIYTSALPKFDGLRFGTGLGVRYYSSFGPIRVDVGTPLNRRTGDARVAVYVSLGQAF